MLNHYSHISNICQVLLTNRQGLTHDFSIYVEIESVFGPWWWSGP